MERKATFLILSFLLPEIPLQQSFKGLAATGFNKAESMFSVARKAPLSNKPR